MGTFRIEVQGTGAHGCSRETKGGQLVVGCGQPRCPDCIARDFVKRLKDVGVYFSGSGSLGDLGFAKLTHWPYGYGTVTDDLLSGIRSGNF